MSTSEAHQKKKRWVLYQIGNWLSIVKGGIFSFFSPMVGNNLSYKNILVIIYKNTAGIMKEISFAHHHPEICKKILKRGLK